MQKLIRITTVPQSLSVLLRGQLRFINDYFEVTAISSPGEILKNFEEKEGVKVIPVKMTRTISPIKDLIALFQLYNVFKRERPFIVHTHTPKAGTLGMIAAKLAGVPCRLHTIAGLPLLETVGIKRKILNIVEKLTYACASKIYPNSYGMRDIIIREKFCKEKKIKVIASGSSNGINLNIFSPSIFIDAEKQILKNNLKLGNDDFVFIFLGRLVADKGINELVNAFNNLWEINQRNKLILVGSRESELDPLSSQTEELIRSHPGIRFVGYQNDVRPLLAISDVLAFPSYREGFPNAVMQAGAMEIPVIVTDINGCNEIVQDGINGLVIPPKNIEKLQNAMKLLSENELLYNQLKKNSRPMIVSRYEQAYFWNELLVEYKKLQHETSK